MIKLTALLGILNGNDGSKARAKRAETDSYHTLKKPGLFNGFRKTYQRLDEENGEQYPDEIELVQANVDDVFAGLIDVMAKAIDDQTAVDSTNGATHASLTFPVRDGEDIVIDDVPVVSLLWLERQLDNMKALIEAAPELNASKQWEWDPQSGRYKTAPRTSIKTKKEPRAMVMYPATDRHPAQVQAYTEDVVVGHWTTVDESGAIPASRKRELLTQLAEVKDIVKTAREQANATAEVHEVEIGREILQYILR